MHWLGANQCFHAAFAFCIDACPAGKQGLLGMHRWGPVVNKVVALNVYVRVVCECGRNIGLVIAGSGE